ncbi:MAG TPA: type 4a pilus biogenesis protein PilO [Burkholderiales bacterium]|jgi:type IV pilus assembly protein PilO
MTLDDLRRLNPRDIGSWPALPKLGALFILLLLLVFGGYWFDWQNQLDDLARSRAREQDLRTSFLDKKKQAVNLEAYRKQLAEIEESFGEMLKQLPNKSEMEALLTDINQAGLGRGLQFELFRPAPTETRSEFYAELPITIKLAGNYHDIGAFASDISQLSRIVTLNDIALSTSKTGLTLDAVAKTFRYLDDSEIAAQRKAARDAGQKKR